MEKLINLLNPFSADFTKWSNTLKQFVGSLSTNYLSVFEHFVELALKELTQILLFGDTSLDVNTNSRILNATIDFVISFKRFGEPLF